MKRATKEAPNPYPTRSMGRSMKVRFVVVEKAKLRIKKNVVTPGKTNKKMTQVNEGLGTKS